MISWWWLPPYVNISCGVAEWYLQLSPLVVTGRMPRSGKLPVLFLLTGQKSGFSPFFVCHAPSPERRVFEGCIVRTRIALPFIGRFRRGLDLFRKGLVFQTIYAVLTFVARWRHNFRKIAVKNCEKSKNRRKSLCAPLRTDSWGFWKKFYHSCLGPRL